MEKFEIQKFEELQIIKFLESVTADSPKVIIDVGGNVGADISDPFIRRGWTSIIIEPQSSCVAKLQEKFGKFENCKIIQGACSDKSETLRLYKGSDGELSETSTFYSGSDPWMDSARSSDFEEIDVVPLYEIVDRENIDGRIGILKVDTESWDYQVLCGFDFQRCKPDVVVTEEYYWKVDDTISKHLLLEDAGYVNAGFVGYNSIWINRDIGARYSYSIMKDWLVKINRYPLKYMGSSDITYNFPQLERENYISPLNNVYSLACLVSNIDIVVSGQKETVDIALVNMTDTNISSVGKAGSTLAVSYRWYRSDQKVEKWDNERTPLLSDIPPSSVQKIKLQVVAPQNPGLYILHVDIVDEGVAWLSEAGAMAGRQSVTVV